MYGHVLDDEQKKAVERMVARHVAEVLCDEASGCEPLKDCELPMCVLLERDQELAEEALRYQEEALDAIRGRLRRWEPAPWSRS